MTTEPKQSPTFSIREGKAWSAIVDETGHVIASDEHETTGRWKENASFIVKACNAHKPLVKSVRDQSTMFHHTNNHKGSWKDCNQPLCLADKAVLILAGEKP